jgi:TetR/AcrR family transcriptional regulator, fatty acid metabolism regulator protein
LNEPYPVARSQAQGRIKIFESVVKLLHEKAFRDITWGEIAKTAGVSEALIYQHYTDRGGLMFGVIEELLEQWEFMRRQLFRGTYGALNKLRSLIGYHINSFHQDRVFAKILLLEVRSYPLFFESRAYRHIQDYGDMILDIINEGIFNKEIRDDIDPKHLRQTVLGTIEHLCLPYVIFDREFSPDELAHDAWRVIFSGIAKNPD